MITNRRNGTIDPKGLAARCARFRYAIGQQQDEIARMQRDLRAYGK
jgi:hypothetical protein